MNILIGKAWYLRRAVFTEPGCRLLAITPASKLHALLLLLHEHFIMLLFHGTFWMASVQPIPPFMILPFPLMSRMLSCIPYFIILLFPQMFWMPLPHPFLLYDFTFSSTFVNVHCTPYPHFMILLFPGTFWILLYSPSPYFMIILFPLTFWIPLVHPIPTLWFYLFWEPCECPFYTSSTLYDFTCSMNLVNAHSTLHPYFMILLFCEPFECSLIYP